MNSSLPGSLGLQHVLSTKQAWWILILINGWHLLWTPWLGIMPQDAYYHLYAMHPSLSYFDHPPGVAWLIRLFQFAGGSHSILLLKLMDWCSSLGVQIGAFMLYRTFTGYRESLTLTAWLATSPIILLLTFNTTPDVPLLLTWVWGLYFLRMALLHGKWMHWLLFSVLAGLTFDSKYTGIWILLGMHGTLIFSSTYRRHYLTLWPYLATILALVVMSPVFIWNYHHGFVSFLFQSGERAATIHRLNPALLPGHLGSQLGVVSPFLLVPIWRAIYHRMRDWLQRSILPDQWSLLIFTAPFVLGFALIALIYWVKINWVLPAYLTGIALAAPWLTRRGFYGHLIFSAVIHVLLALEVAFYPVPIHSDDTWYGWEKLAEQVKNIQTDYPDDFVFSMDGYKTTAVLRFINRDQYFGENILGKPALHFDYLGEDIQQLEGKNALFIDSDPGLKDSNQEVPDLVKDHFGSTVYLRDIDIYRGNTKVRHFRVFRCLDYLGPGQKKVR